MQLERIEVTQIPCMQSGFAVIAYDPDGAIDHKKNLTVIMPVQRGMYIICIKDIIGLIHKINILKHFHGIIPP